MGSPSSRLNPQIIGAEDDYFDTEQEQVRVDNRKNCFMALAASVCFCSFSHPLFLSYLSISPYFFFLPLYLSLSLSLCQINGQCSCFQSMELLKSRPAHLAAFLHHVVSQFDPAPLVRTYTHTQSILSTVSDPTHTSTYDFYV